MESQALPHIILIVMDSAGAKHCSAYGHFRDTTPGLKRLAEEGVLYRHCFTAAHSTIASHASLFTGLYPGDHGCSMFNALPSDCFTLAEILGDMGYRTVGLSSNLLVSHAYRFNQGFQEFYEMESLFNSERYYEAKSAFASFKKESHKDWDRLRFLIKYSWQKNYYLYPVHNLLNRIYSKLQGRITHSSAAVTERTLRIAKKIMTEGAKKTPIFLFINFMETHYNYNPPSNYNNIIKIDEAKKNAVLQLKPQDFYVGRGFSPEEIEILQLLYEQEIAYLDDRLWDLYLFLKNTGLSDNTMFIVTADHGDGFGEHGLWGHMFGLYNELIHIPLVIKYPESYGLRGESSNLVQLHDLFATIAEMADCPHPVPDSSRSMLGVPRDFAMAEKYFMSFNAARFRQADPNFQPLKTMQHCSALIDSELRKLIMWADGRGELYNLKKDFAEENNLILHPEYQGVEQDLKQRLLPLISGRAGREKDVEEELEEGVGSLGA